MLQATLLQLHALLAFLYPPPPKLPDETKKLDLAYLSFLRSDTNRIKLDCTCVYIL